MRREAALNLGVFCQGAAFLYFISEGVKHMEIEKKYLLKELPEFET